MNETAFSAECRRFSALTRTSSARRWARRLPAVLACASAAAVLAACGSGSGGVQAADNGSSGGSTANVTIGKAVDTIGFTTVDVAKAKGYFARQGVNVNEVLLSGCSSGTWPATVSA